MPDPETDLLARITTDPGIFSGKPIIRGHQTRSPRRRPVGVVKLLVDGCGAASCDFEMARFRESVA